jgi:hypothetical protein
MSGLLDAARRPWLLIIPLVLDLLLWSAPKLSIASLTQRFLRVWETLVRATYSTSQLEIMSDMLMTVREGMTTLGRQVNLLDSLAGSWLGPPSIVAASQTTRLNFISELILAPVGLIPSLPEPMPAPWQSAPVEIGSLWVTFLIVAALWFAAQIIAVLWLRWVAAGTLGQTDSSEPSGGTGRGWGHFAVQAAQLTGFCLFLGVLLFALRLPLGFAVVLLLLSGSPLTGGLFALVGGITLWITLWMLLSLYFTSEGLLFERQPVWRSMLQGAAMTRGNVLVTLGLICLINLILVGFRVVWGLIGQSPTGVIVAMLGNAYLATAMLRAVFTHYGELRQRWLATQSKASAANQPTDKGKE